MFNAKQSATANICDSPNLHINAINSQFGCDPLRIFTIGGSTRYSKAGFTVQIEMRGINAITIDNRRNLFWRSKVNGQITDLDLERIQIVFMPFTINAAINRDRLVLPNNATLNRNLSRIFDQTQLLHHYALLCVASLETNCCVQQSDGLGVLIAQQFQIAPHS